MKFVKMKKSGFTVLEMLVVIAVIGILATFLLPALEHARARAKMGKAKAIVESMSAAIKMYYLDYSAYPIAGSNLYTILSTKYEAGVNSSVSAGPYMEFRQEDIATGTVKDPWGQDYIYTFPGVINTNSVDIHSIGPDGIYGDGITAKGGDTTREDSNGDGLDDDNDNQTNWN